ncbi:3-hydroxybutyrate dehydrogenase [Yunchengibacter salinarum]|uniref:3-hydroxybutyrate dehydrogenase n=1 Tax=Yunchengibacter salinarum TaxID=3133399 RepID=UPI0035B6521B
MQDLKGKTAVITGSTSGIGLGLAEGLAAAGVDVVLNGFGDADEIRALQQRIEQTHGVRALYIEADLMKGAAAADLIRQAEARLGRVDILVNNAGIQHVSPVESFPDDKWEAIIALNLSSSFYTIKAALPGMKQRGFGRIVNIASAHGLVASPFKGAYVAAKHGVVGLTKTVGLEVAEEDNLTINAICPGYVRTPLVDGQIRDQARAHNMSEDQVIRDVILAAQPNKRFVTVLELAAFTRLLCSEEGRSFNGAALPMEGGWTAR